jgi:Zn-dependent protease with chaperone function
MGVRLRAALSVAVLLGYFVVLAVVVGFFVLALIDGLSTLTLVYAPMFLLVGVVLGKFSLGTREPEPVGAFVSRAGQPELWRVVDELAVAANTRPPDEIRIVPDVNAAVWEDTRLLGLRSGFRHLAVGLPLLAGLSVSELRATVGHELGHFSHGHTRLLAVTYRAKVTMARTAAQLDGFFGSLFNGYARLYLLVARSANRAQELQADAAAVRAAGKEAMSAALRKTLVLDVAWGQFKELYVELAPYVGRTPDLLHGFHAFVTHPNRQRELEHRSTQLLDTEPASRFDSHPATRVRLAALAELTDVDTDNDHRPAWELLTTPDVTLPRLERQLLTDELGPRASWEEIVKLAGARSAATGAAELVRLGKESGLAPGGSLDEILDAVARGEGKLLLADILEPGQDAFVRDTLITLIDDAVVDMLVRADQAVHELNWSGSWHVRLADGEILDVSDRLSAAIDDPAEMPAFRDWVRTLTGTTQDHVSDVRSR